MELLLLLTLTGFLTVNGQEGSVSPLPPPYPPFENDDFPPPFMPEQPNLEYMRKDELREEPADNGFKNLFIVKPQSDNTPQRGEPMDIPQQTQTVVRNAKQFLLEPPKSVPPFAPGYSSFRTNQPKTPRKFESMTPDGFKSTIEEIGEKWLPPLQGESAQTAKFPLQDWDQDIMKRIMELGNPFASGYTEPFSDTKSGPGDKGSKIRPQESFYPQQSTKFEIEPIVRQSVKQRGAKARDHQPEIEEPKYETADTEDPITPEIPTGYSEIEFPPQEEPKFETQPMNQRGMKIFPEPRAKPKLQLEEFAAPTSKRISGISYAAEDLPRYTPMESVLKQLPGLKSITEEPMHVPHDQEFEEQTPEEVQDTPGQEHTVYKPKRNPGTYQRRHGSRRTYVMEEEPRTHHPIIRGEEQYRRYFANQRRHSSPRGNSGRISGGTSYQEFPNEDQYQEYVPVRPAGSKIRYRERQYHSSRAPRRPEMRRTEPEEPIIDYPAPEIPKDAAKYISKWSHVSAAEQSKKGIYRSKNKPDYPRSEPFEQDIRPRYHQEANKGAFEEDERNRYQEVNTEPAKVEPTVDEGKKPRVTYQRLPGSKEQQGDYEEHCEECENCPCCGDGSCECCSDCEGGEEEAPQEEGQETKSEVTTPEAEEVTEEQGPRQRTFFTRGPGRRVEGEESKKKTTTEKPESDYYTITSKETS